VKMIGIMVDKGKLLKNKNNKRMREKWEVK
jgi:hypothetical protein